MSDLDKLIKAVEAGTATELQFHTWRPGLTGTKKESRMMWRAYSREDMNAAKALHDALLPGRDFLLGPLEGGRFLCGIDHADSVGKGFWNESTDLARAWLLAILRAHRSQVQP